MAEENSSRRVESSLKRTRFLGHLGLMAGVFRELEVDKLIDEKLPKERDHNVPHSVCIFAMVSILYSAGQHLNSEHFS